LLPEVTLVGVVDQLSASFKNSFVFSALNADKKSFMSAAVTVSPAEMPGSTVLLIFVVDKNDLSVKP
jgi:hypothetical protein